MLAEAIHDTRSEIIATLKQASAATGSDFQYLLGTAIRESHLQPTARAASSSACGLFQFTEQTWLGMVKQHGARFGLGSYAAAISRDTDGRYHVNDRADRHAILALRNDPRTSALMAGEYANETRCRLQGELGRNVCSGELYAAHFLGPQAACRLIRMSETQPGACAAAAFPQAAGANRNVFYHRDGSAKTVREVYAWATQQPATDSVTGPQKARPERPSLEPSQPLPRFDAGDAFESSGAQTSLVTLGGLSTAPFSLTSGVLHMLGSLSNGDEPGF